MTYSTSSLIPTEIPANAPHRVSTAKRGNSQIVGLDILRFIAAMWVVVHHLGYWAQETRFNSYHASGGLRTYPEIKSLASIGWLGVPIFFVISGFVIAYTAERATPSQFAIGRALRLVPTMWICATGTLLISLCFDVVPLSGLINQYARSVLFAPFPPYIDDSTWTLWVEISFYVLIWGLIYINRFDRLKLLAIGIGSISTACWIAYLALPAVFPSAISTRANAIFDGNRLATLLLLRHGMYFAIGVMLWLWLVKLSPGRIAGWMSIFSVGAYINITQDALLHDRFTGDHTQPVLPVLCFAVFLIAFCVSIRWNNNIRRAFGPNLTSVIRTMGLMTYPLYLVHQIAGAYLLGTVSRAYGWHYLALSLVIALALGSSWLVAVWVEPPVQSVLRKFLDKVRGNLPPRAVTDQA